MDTDCVFAQLSCLVALWERAAPSRVKPGYDIRESSWVGIFLTALGLPQSRLLWAKERACYSDTLVYKASYLPSEAQLSSLTTTTNTTTATTSSFPSLKPSPQQHLKPQNIQP